MRRGMTHGHHDEAVLQGRRWHGQEAIDRHHASPAMEAIARLRDKHDLHMRAKRHVSDEVGVPAKDQGFLRQ